MLIGYARVSTGDQNLDVQQDELTRAGCKRICTDVASGAKSERPGLNDALTYARAGDTLRRGPCDERSHGRAGAEYRNRDALPAE